MNIFMKNQRFSQKALSAALSFAVVVSLFQPIAASAFTLPVVAPGHVETVVIETITTPGTTTWTVPDGVTEIRVKTWGAGGSGGKGATTTSHVLGGGGGGGGGYAENDAFVTPGDTFTAVVGRGGVSSEEGAGRSGQASSFSSSTSTLTSAAGGIGGKRGTELQAPAPTISLSATPKRFNSGQSTTIVWSSNHTDSCTASGMISGAKPTSGSQSVTRTSSGSVTFTCTGLGGTASASLSVTVDNCGPRGGCYTGPDESVTSDSTAADTVVTVNPLAADGAAFTGAGGAGLVGRTLESGESATAISFDSASNVSSTDGGDGARGGAGGSLSTTGAGADGVAPAAGAGGSDVALGGNGAHGQIVIEAVVRGGPATNDAPTAPVVVGPTGGDAGVSYSFSAQSTDPDGDSIRYGFDWDNDGSIDQWTALATSGVAMSLSHTFSDEGAKTFKVFAEDASGNRSAATSHTITLQNCGPRGGCYPGNTAPDNFTVNGPTTGTVNVSYDFATRATDAEGDTVRYGFDWDNNGSYEEYTAFGASGVSTTTSHSWGAAGTYTFRVIAEDNAGERSSALSHTITITSGGGTGGNSAPTGLAVSGPTTGDVSTSYTFSATATDPDGDSVRYGFDWDNNGTIDAYTMFVTSGTAATSSKSWSADGTYTFKVFAEDASGNRSAGVSHTIVISDNCGPRGGCYPGGNNAPVVNSITGTTTAAANVSHTFTATATDADGDDIQYGFDWNNNGTIETSAGEEWTPVTISGVAVSRSMSWTVSGPHTFGVFARDVHGATSTARTFTVTITGGVTGVGLVLGNTSGLTTSEAGATAAFTVVLSSAPTGNVTLPIVVSDTTEGSTTVAALTFTPANWNVYQTVIVTGVDDTVDDGDVTYAVNVGPSSSTDANYNGLPAQSVSIINFDNDDTVTPPGTTGGGGGGGRSGGPCIGFGCSTATTITTVIPTVNFCPASDFLVSYLRKGSQNDPNEVRKLQWFLNTYEGTNLEISGFFDDATEQAVMLLQTRHADEILAPWNIAEPTGIVYITTSSYINRFFCDENPIYQPGDLDFDIGIQPTEEPVIDNSGDFEGAIGMATTSATSTSGSIFENLAGVFGAFSEGVINFFKSIPWYPLLIVLLITIGTAYILRGIFARGLTGAATRMSFIKGATGLAAGTVLNVLNTMSFMKDPDWFTQSTGLGMSWVLALGLINLLAVLVVSLSYLVKAYVEDLQASK